MFPPPQLRWRGDFILPMINIVFLLLLFFLTAGSLANRNEAQSAIPITATLPLERLPRPLLLVQSDGSLELDGRPVTRDDVVRSVRNGAAGTGEAAMPVSVLADPDMPATTLLTLVDALRAEGVGIRLVTLRRGASQAGAQ
jgi:biopolymer transport protein ExbD